jgi:hypothetical protein
VDEIEDRLKRVDESLAKQLQRSIENNARLVAEMAEWKQAASVEAGLRREFAARIAELEGALQISQEIFAVIVNPQDHPNTSVQHLWAQCKEIECKIRDLLQPKDGAK